MRSSSQSFRDWTNRRTSCAPRTRRPARRRPAARDHDAVAARRHRDVVRLAHRRRVGEVGVDHDHGHLGRAGPRGKGGGDGSGDEVGVLGGGQSVREGRLGSVTRSLLAFTLTSSRHHLRTPGSGSVVP